AERQRWRSAGARFFVPGQVHAGSILELSHVARPSALALVARERGNGLMRSPRPIARFRGEVGAQALVSAQVQQNRAGSTPAKKTAAGLRPRSRCWTLRLRPRLGAHAKRVQTEN